MRLEIVSGDKNGTIVKSSLISDWLEPLTNEDDQCNIRFYYHFMVENAIFALRLSVRYDF